MTASVEPEGLAFQCKCGHRMVFPRDREIEEGRCPNCLAIIRPRDVLGAQAAADGKKPKRKEKEHAHAASQPVLIRSDAAGIVIQCKCGQQVTAPPGSQSEHVRCPECFAMIRVADFVESTDAKSRKDKGRPDVASKIPHPAKGPVLVGVNEKGMLIQCKCGCQVTAARGQEEEHVRCPECLALIRLSDLIEEGKDKRKPKPEKRRSEKRQAKTAPEKAHILTSDANGLLIQCKCGNKMPIPKAQASEEVRCPNCLAIIKPSTLIEDPKHKKNDDVLPEVKKYVYNPYADVDPVELLVTAVKWSGLGALGAGATGALGGAAYGSLTAEMGPSGPAIVWGFSGAMLGILFFGTWGITRIANLPMERCILVGVTIGTILAAIDWFLETYIVSITDATALSCFVVGMLGGVVTGLFISLIQHPISEDDLP